MADSNSRSNNGGNGAPHSALGALEVLATNANSGEGHSSSGKRKKHRGCDGKGKQRKEMKVKSRDTIMSTNMADGMKSSQNGTADSEETEGTELRKGKWTVEEEEYTTRVIHYFSSGLITLPEGKTLRSYLAEKLQCDPMRITKKYAGAACLGKRIHHLCESPSFTPQEIEMAKAEIERLEERFRTRLVLGAGAALPPLQLPPIIHGNTRPVEETSAAGSSNNFNSQFQPSAGSGQPLNNSTAALLQSLAGDSRLVTSHASNANISRLLNSFTQSNAAPPQLQYLNELNPELRQILQQANISMPPPAAQNIQNPPGIGLHQLLPSSQNVTATTPQPMSALTSGLGNISNEQLAGALLAEITDKLQQLATVSPSLFQNVQSHMSTVATDPNHSMHTSFNPNDQRSLPHSFQPIISPPYSQGVAFGHQQQQTLNSMNMTGLQHIKQPHSIHGMLQAYSAQQQPSESAASRNLRSLIAAQQSAAANAANNASLASSYNTFMSNLAAAVVDAQQIDRAQEQNHVTQPQLMGQANDFAKALSDLVDAQNHSMNAGNEDMSKLINALRTDQAEALINAQSSGTEAKLSDDSRSKLNINEENLDFAEENATKHAGVVFHNDTTNISSEGTISFYTKKKRSTSSNSLSDEGYDCTRESGPLKKRMKPLPESNDGISSKDLEEHNKRMEQTYV